jgi:hypothetical protein
MQSNNPNSCLLRHNTMFPSAKTFKTRLHLISWSVSSIQSIHKNTGGVGDVVRCIVGVTWKIKTTTQADFTALLVERKDDMMELII